MFKKILVPFVLVAVMGVFVFGAVNIAAAQGGIQGAGQGGYGGSRGAIGSATGLLPAAGSLSASEAAALAYMREEEKLAHDVYVTLYIRWGLPLFQNIAASEQAHTDAVKMLLDRYGVADPASSTVGVFSNPELQALYNDLVTIGNQSLADALKVGAAIEEIDIIDLDTRLAETDNADIQQVFTNLRQGSESHLRAFTTTLQTQTGETYAPQYLTPEAYQEILSGSAGNGKNGSGNGRWGRQ
ncbi:MAG: DUF2202 domain-containing protein [Chloroflexota bacterium]